MKKPFKYFVIHCTATHEGQNITPETIVRWHTAEPPNGRGWSQVGYSDMIMLDGSRHQFVKHNGDRFIETNEITNGVKGINSIARHVVYVGGLEPKTPNKKPKAKNTLNTAQKQTLISIIKEVLAYQPDVIIGGHNQFDNKACPSFWVPKFLESIGIPDKNIYKNDPFGYGKLLQ
jgi:N-acetylmuramoyl-L-alanine amidase